MSRDVTVRCKPSKDEDTIVVCLPEMDGLALRLFINDDTRPSHFMLGQRPSSELIDYLKKQDAGLTHAERRLVAILWLKENGRPLDVWDTWIAE